MVRLAKTLVLLLAAAFAATLLVGESLPQVGNALESSSRVSTRTDAAVVADIASSSSFASSSTSPEAVDTYYTVGRVIDGDTISVIKNGAPETVRLIGINTPETVHPTKTVECFGREASAKTKALLLGNRVRLLNDPTQNRRDSYGRLLAYVYLEDGTNVNEELIRTGHAHEYTFLIPYTYQVAFKQAEAEARIGKRGLWADGVCATAVPVATPLPVAAQVETRPLTPTCDPNYEGACVPVSSDVDCAGGSGNGPAYVTGPVSVVGVDIYGLDRDGDGVACE